MPYKYRYVGDLPTAFITLRKSNKTWVPEYGDTITSLVEISHPLLELVVKDQQVKKEIVKQPAVPESQESPVSDESQENA